MRLMKLPKLSDDAASYEQIDCGRVGDCMCEEVTTEYTHRVAIANFRRTFHHDGTISPGW
jgi:hypothetical protein